MSFQSLGLIEPLCQPLQALGYDTPTAIQSRAIPVVLAGRDLMAAAQTGTGKTAAFGLPLLQRLLQQGSTVASNGVRALVLVPTRELAEQVHENLQSYAGRVPLRTAVVYGGVSINPQMMKLRRGVDVLVATPGRLLDLYRQNALKFTQLQALVLDEADRMLDLGFAADLQHLLQALPPRRQTLLFSATFSDAVRGLADVLLNNPQRIDVTPRHTAAQTVRQWLVPVDKKRKAELFLELYQQQRWTQVLVFAKTRKGVELLVGQLQAAGIVADSIHGDKTQPARLKALERFKSGEVRVLVATDVAARGLDIPDMPQVVNFDLPIVAEDYVHRIGRTGRAGNSGNALSLVAADEVNLLAAIEVLLKQVIERRDIPGFIPEHRVPQTDASGQVRKKPKKPKVKSATVTAPALEQPKVRAIRKMPSFNKR